MGMLPKLLGISLGLSATLALAMPVEQRRDVAIAPCEGRDGREIAELIKQDYLQRRVVAWEADQKYLGQNDPVVWINTAEITGEPGHWQVPLTVHGRAGEIHYQVIVECKTGSVRYIP